MMKILYRFLCISLLILICTTQVSATIDISEKVVIDNASTDLVLKVMSYNIHFCDPPNVAGSQTDLDSTAGVLAAQKPDIIMLQEVDMNTNRSGNVHQAKKIAEKLGMNYFFAPAKNVTGGLYGVAILSKYAMSEATIYVLPMPDTSGEVRILATAKIVLEDGSQVRIGCTHFDLVTENKKAEVAEIVRIAKSEPLPFIIAGDLNSWENSGVIATLDSEFTRTCNGCPLTSPARNPQNTIDYIAFRDPENRLSIISHKAINETYASDHRPIVAEIGLKRTNLNPYTEHNEIINEDFSSTNWENELLRLNPGAINGVPVNPNAQNATPYSTPLATGTNSYTNLNSTDLYFDQFRLVGAIESLPVLPCASNSDTIKHDNNDVAVAFRLKNDNTGLIEFPEIPNAGSLTMHVRNGNADNITTMGIEKFEEGNWVLIKNFNLTPNGAFQNVRDEIVSFDINSEAPIKLRLRNTGTRYINIYRACIGAYNSVSKTDYLPKSNLKLIGRKLISDTPIKISIYNLVGVLLFEEKQKTEVNLPIYLNRGIYIVKTSQGAQKILLY